jgi:hypothetical protein
MPMVIKRVGPLSCAKIAGALYALMGLVFGVVVSLVILSGLAADTSDGAAFGAAFGIGAVFLLPIAYGALGFVTTLIGAWLYNVLAAMLGGIQMDVQ